MHISPGVWAEFDKWGAQVKSTCREISMAIVWEEKVIPKQDFVVKKRVDYLHNIKCRCEDNDKFENL
jgi:hypothetical protein